MAKIDPTKTTSKWLSNTQGATQSYKDGVDSVQVAPGESAVAHQDTLKARFNQSVDNGTWAANTLKTDLTTWKTAAKNKGAARLADGAAMGQSKYQKYITAAAPVYAANRAEIAAMPNVTDADREARMRRNLQLMRQMKGLGK